MSLYFVHLVLLYGHDILHDQSLEKKRRKIQVAKRMPREKKVNMRSHKVGDTDSREKMGERAEEEENKNEEEKAYEERGEMNETTRVCERFWAIPGTIREWPYGYRLCSFQENYGLRTRWAPPHETLAILFIPRENWGTHDGKENEEQKKQQNTKGRERRLDSRKEKILERWLTIIHTYIYWASPLPYIDIYEFEGIYFFSTCLFFCFFSRVQRHGRIHACDVPVSCNYERENCEKKREPQRKGRCEFEDNLCFGSMVQPK